ncbi:hypothetical protein GWK47_033757 [Chionoecetes opilio]|uniref:Uncharacterized protein n=1 Tax=Chionoecetes opilio TaxID=41210 RepID=A0A8J4YJH1_CHIOP|nr:hypothetical protein GWK47_033757 [Chionoecetes opilio]
MSEGFISPGFTSPGFTSPETNPSKEMEEMNNAETEKLVALANADDALEVKVISGGKGKNTSKSSGKGKKSLKKKSSDEECLILSETSKAFQKLQALRTSYKLLHNMTESDFEQRMDESLPYLKRVIRGVEPNERHELFMTSSRQLRTQQDYLIYGPFTADQSFHVLGLLKEKLGHMDKLIGKINDVLVYRVRVLVPTFFTKIVMENESVSMAEAYRLMAKFSLDREIADDISSAESRKF